MEKVKKEPEVKVRLDQTSLNAFVRIAPPDPVLPERIMAALSSSGVIEGIDETTLERIASAPVRDEVLIATGLPPINGEDARLEFLFVGSSAEIKPLELEGGRVDYREVNFIPFVDPGFVLARKIPSTEGTPGRSVEGKPIPPVSGRNVELIPGKNVALSEDKLELTAKLGGQPILDKNKVSVNPLCTITKDVDFSVGNISFNGSVMIQGSVHNGFTIKATGDIEVSGTVEGAKIEAGGRITIKGGVRVRSTVWAGQDVVVRFCDTNSKITCKRDLFIQDSSMNCDLVAGRKINIAKELIGGKARAGEMIVATTMGTASEAPTLVEIDQQQPEVIVENLKNELAEIEEEMAALNRQAQDLIAKKEKGALQKLTSQKISIQMRYQTKKAELDEAENDPMELAPPRIVVKGEVYPGATLKINQWSVRITEKHHASTFRISEGAIVGG